MPKKFIMYFGAVLRIFSLKRLFIVIIICEILLMIMVVYFLQISLKVGREKNNAEAQHYAMHQAIDELSSTIENMSKLAYMYVYTGEKEYKDSYDSLFNSQSGKIARDEKNYLTHLHYLDLVKIRNNNMNMKISYIDSIEKLSFTKNEKELISDVWNNVLELSYMERVAINFTDEISDSFSNIKLYDKNKKRIHAIEILKSKTYNNLKKSSMDSIEKLISDLHERVSGEIGGLTKDLEMYGNIFKATLGLFIVSNIAVFFLLQKRVISVIHGIVGQIKNYEKKKFQIDCNKFGKYYEFGALIKEFNRLHTIIDKRTEILEGSYDKILNLYKVINRYINISETDINGHIVFVSDAFCEISGYRREELMGKDHTIIKHQDVSNDEARLMWEAIQSGEPWTGQVKNKRKDGSVYWVEAFIDPIINKFGEITGYRSIHIDITDKKRIEKISITDKLTGLYNRSKIDDVFQYEIHRAGRYSKKLSVILLDIDKFKEVNDDYGHLSGDHVIQDFAEILKSNVRVVDIVGRWGGEEFLIISPESRLDEATDMAEKLREIISSHKFSDIEKVTASFGVASFMKGDSMDTMIERADRGLYKAKNSGRNKTVAIKK